MKLIIKKESKDCLCANGDCPYPDVTNRRGCENVCEFELEKEIDFDKLSVGVKNEILANVIKRKF